MQERRNVRVIGSKLLRIPDGFISWEEHLKVWEAYHKKMKLLNYLENNLRHGGHGNGRI